MPLFSIVFLSVGSMDRAVFCYSTKAKTVNRFVIEYCFQSVKYLIAKQELQNKQDIFE